MAFMSPKTVKSVATLMIMGALMGCSGRGAEAQVQPLPANSDDVLRREVNVLANVLRLVQGLSMNEADYNKMVGGAIKGALQTLDPHSDYLTAEQFKEMQEGAKGEFGGLGIEISQERGLIKIVAPIDDTPAHRAGIQAGDFIVRIDDKPVTGMSMNDAVKKMRGKPGTNVKLLIMRPGAKEAIKVDLTREVIKVNPVKSAVIDGDIGYIRLSTFISDSADRKIIDAVKNIERSGNIKGYVLDLRDNPGGYLKLAETIADMFLDNKETIVSVRSRDPQQNTVTKATPGDIINGKPLIVLTNKGSASASEVVAGALQDHKRAIILGTQTFGKGSVQSVIPLAAYFSGRQDAIKVTTSLYYAPSGRSIQGRGITPDVLFRSSENDESQRLSEADMEGAIANPNGTAVAPVVPPVKTSEVCAAFDEKASAQGLQKELVLRNGNADNQLLCAAAKIRGSVSDRVQITPFVEEAIPPAPRVN